MTTPGELMRFVRFVSVGLASTGLYFLLLWVFEPLIADVFVLTAFCYMLSMVANYLVQGRFTFQTQKATATSFKRYVVMHGVAMASNSLVTGGLVTWLGLPLYGTQLVIMGLVAVSTFIVSKKWVFAS